MTHRQAKTDAGARLHRGTDSNNSSSSNDGPGAYGENLAPGARAPACYAAGAIASRGREFPESPCPTRGDFQRDRDRVIHASPFRRLTYKTQVFLFHEGDHYRTRLTHSLEVAQIARTLARQLRLDEDLAETLALAHDLGHSPFGHAGERALDDVMRNYGGFDHNAQSIRIITRLERKYPDFDGLNLTWETLEGLAKHNGPVLDPANSISRATRSLERWRSLDLNNHAGAEAQAAALADDIAYVNHDIDDGLRAGLLKLSDMDDAPLIGPMIKGLATSSQKRTAPPRRRGAASSYDPAESYVEETRAIYQLNRDLIAVLTADCVTESRARLAALRPTSPDDIRRASAPVIAFSPALAADITGLKSFLFARVYRHAKVMNVMDRAQTIVHELFEAYFSKPDEMHARWANAANGLDERTKARLVADFVAGMTDRLALLEHARLFDASPYLG